MVTPGLGDRAGQNPCLGICHHKAAKGQSPESSKLGVDLKAALEEAGFRGADCRKCFQRVDPVTVLSARAQQDRS